MSTAIKKSSESLTLLLHALKLPGFAAHYLSLGKSAEKEGLGFDDYLKRLCETEITERRQRKTERLLRISGLPKDKTLATLDQSRLGAAAKRQLSPLCSGDFADKGENVLVFGLPGRGKTHFCCAIAHELIRNDKSVLFTPTYKLVQQLLVAKRDLVLPKELKRLDAFDVIMLDDIGYVQQDRDEMEVLFTFLSERNERRSVMITSNLVFSQWDKIFKDAMTTACAIDRLVHRATIIEMTGSSFRSDAAKERHGKAVVEQTATS
jgi:DNA replication protein DnaC